MDAIGKPPFSVRAEAGPEIHSNQLVQRKDTLYSFQRTD